MTRTTGRPSPLSAVARPAAAQRAQRSGPASAALTTILAAWTAVSFTACTTAFRASGSTDAATGVRHSGPPPWSDRNAATTTAPQAGAFDHGRASFSVEVQDVESSYRITPVFVLPGQEVTVRVAGASGTVQAAAEAGQLRIDGPRTWTWTAPAAPGTHPCIRFTEARRLDSICVKAFVLQPYHGEDSVGGFRIGHYQRDLREGDPAYALPQGLLRVSADEIGEPVSPHFRLGQFLCKQEGSFPKFLVLKTALLIKLEMLLEKLAAEGVVADTLHVMSGYRTPYYNAEIGNETSYSRHAYGDAADVYVDRDADGIMDDIDGDGRSDTQDARLMYRVVDSTLDEAGPGRLAGGLAVYGPNSAHGPFVHVDTRGHRARW